MAGDDDQKLQFGFGKFSISTTGATTMIVVVMLAQMLAAIWATRTILEDVRSLQKTFVGEDQTRAADHRKITNEIDKLMCLNTLSKEDQQAFRQSPGNWTKWCWWVDDNGSGK